MNWSPREEKWNEGYQHLLEYSEMFGETAPNTLYVSPDGYKLGEWLRNQKRRKKSGTLPKDKLQKLETMLQGE